MSCLDRRVEAPCRRARRRIELVTQHRAQPLKLAQRLVSLAGKCIQAHEGDVGVFAHRLRPHELAEHGHGLSPAPLRHMQTGGLGEERHVHLVQLLSPRRGPIFVEVMGQQIAGIEIERSRVVGKRSRAACQSGRLFEGVDIHPHRGRRAEYEDIPAEVEEAPRRAAGVVRLKHAAGDVQGAMQAIGRVGERGPGPELIERTLAQHPVSRREG